MLADEAHPPVSYGRLEEQPSWCDPCAQRRAAVVQEERPLPVPIVILDDDQEFGAFLCTVLADAGYTPSACVAGIGVHEIVRGLAPAALILDVPHDRSASALHWPALAVLAQETALRHIPLLACVPDGDDDALRQVAALGLPSSTILCKPIILDDLLARLGCLVGDDVLALA